jgi:hypothetical protein
MLRPPHRLDLMGDRDAGDGGSPQVVVGDQKHVSRLAQGSDLMAHMHQIRQRGRLNLAHDLETIIAHNANLGAMGHSRDGPLSVRGRQAHLTRPGTTPAT